MTTGYWLLGVSKNRKSYFLSGFTLEKAAIWTTRERDARQFDSRPYAHKFKNTYFPEHDDVYIVSREDPYLGG